MLYTFQSNYIKRTILLLYNHAKDSHTFTDKVLVFEDLVKKSPDSYQVLKLGKKKTLDEQEHVTKTQAKFQKPMYTLLIP